MASEQAEDSLTPADSEIPQVDESMIETSQVHLEHWLKTPHSSSEGASRIQH